MRRNSRCSPGCFPSPMGAGSFLVHQEQSPAVGAAFKDVSFLERFSVIHLERWLRGAGLLLACCCLWLFGGWSKLCTKTKVMHVPSGHCACLALSGPHISPCSDCTPWAELCPSRPTGDLSLHSSPLVQG